MDLVVGLGVTGKSVLRYFALMHQPVYAYETRADFDFSALEKQFPTAKFAAGELPKAWKKQVKRVIISPGVPHNQIWLQELKQQGAEVIGDIELFVRATSVPIIAITGSNGKSTVATLCAQLLAAGGFSVGLGGNIGEPALNFLMAEQEYDVFVLELSSFQLDTTYSLHSKAATILNLSPDHLDRYPNYEAYVQSKLKILHDSEQVVLPQELADLMHLSSGKNNYIFGLNNSLPADVSVQMKDGKEFIYFADQPLLPVESLKLQAPHQVLNAMAAIALCSSFELDNQVIAQVLQEFAGLEHRTELVAEIDGVRWINDSKGTNVGATLAAIESLGAQLAAENKIILLAGGLAKDMSFAELVPGVQKFVGSVLLFGRDANLIAEATKDFVPTEVFDEMSEAVARAQALTRSGWTVLLSPACASQDQFKNYQQRGEVFKQLVWEIAGEAK